MDFILQVSMPSTPRLLEIAELLRKHPCAPRPQNRFFSYLLRQPFAYVEFI